MELKDIQKSRFSRGAIVYNTNNNQYAIVVNGKKGQDDDPCSLVMELCQKEVLLHTPPNRALIPTGQFFNMDNFIKTLNGC